MKKFDLVHTTILIVAILLGYASLQMLIATIDGIAVAANPGFPSYFALTVNNLVLACLYGIASYVLVRNGRKYADAILKDEDTEDAPRLDLDRKNILYVLFIGIGLYTMIEAIPQFLNELYQIFSGRISPDNSMTQQISASGIAVRLLKIVIGAFLVYASPNLTDFIEKHISPRLTTQKQIQQPEPPSHPQTQSSTSEDV